MARPTQSKKKLLILGGGAAGLLTAMKAGPAQDELGLEITLVDCKTFFEYTPALISVLYEKTDEKFEQHFRKVTTDYENFLAKYRVKFVLGVVKHMTDDRVVLSQKDDELHFDMAVICCGSSYHDPWKISCKNGATIKWRDRLDDLRSQRDRYKSAKSILCIGGGPVAVEVAAEIAYRAPSKNITLVNSSDVVLAGTPEKMSHGAQTVLQNLDTLRLISGERAEPKDDDDSTFVTDKTQTTVDGDLVYLCTGVKPNTWFLPDDWLDDKQRIKVDNCFRVEAISQGNIFALGDANNINEPNLFFTAHMQAVHFVKNLYRKDQAPVPYHGSQLSMVISLGPSYAVGSISGFSLTGWPLTPKRGSKIASLMKHLIEHITMNDFHSKNIANDILYYMHENNHLPQKILRTLTLTASQQLAID